MFRKNITHKFDELISKLKESIKKIEKTQDQDIDELIDELSEEDYDSWRDYSPKINNYISNKNVARDALEI